jgi:hypothetical protein
VEKGRGVGVYFPVWRGQGYSRRRGEELRSNMRLSLRLWLAPRLPFENSTNQKPCTTLYVGTKSNDNAFLLMMQIQTVTIHRSGLHLLHLMFCLLCLYSLFYVVLLNINLLAPEFF